MSVSYYAGGGANSIGKSFSLLKLDNYYLGIDWGGGYESPYSQPRYKGPINSLFVSHAHFDHCGQVPRLVSDRGGKLRIFATTPTIDLCRVGWKQTLNLLSRKEQPLPFSSEDAERTINLIEPIECESEVKLSDKISVYPINAGHILGSISLLVIYNNEAYFLTSDICFQDRNLIKGAPKMDIARTRLLVRESTYIGKPFQTREEVISDFVKTSHEILSQGGRILVPALSVDRTQDLYAVAVQSRLSNAFPVYIDGSKETTEIYANHLGPKAEFLKSAMRFEGFHERRKFLESGRPGMIIASSGMLHEGSASSFWAKGLAPNRNDAVFSVNYQDPEGEGSKFLRTERDNALVFGGQIVRRSCQIRSFNFSAHMSGEDGRLLEERLNPDVVIYNHGQEAQMSNFISNASTDRKRIMARAGKWEEI